MKSRTTRAVIFEKSFLEPGEEKTFCVDAPKGKYVPVRLLILQQTAKGVEIVGLKVSDRVVMGRTKIMDKSVDFAATLQSTGPGGRFAVVQGCVFELTLKNEGKERVEVLAGISGYEEVE